jgi:hypothetical protein
MKCAAPAIDATEPLMLRGQCGAHAFWNVSKKQHGICLKQRVRDIASRRARQALRY